MTAARHDAAPATEPQHVQVQHILIGLRPVPGNRSHARKDEAKSSPTRFWTDARQENDDLVKQYTDDSPGHLRMSGSAARPGEFPRDGMVAAFGNVGFTISPGISIADWDPVTSPYGWHVIKRLK
jgi:hypothetical protein